MSEAETEAETEAEDEVEATDFSFDELSDKAKEFALDNSRDLHVQWNDWWDGVYEDAVRMAALLGIEIQSKTREVGIYFSGFWSQGDGACFVGAYRCAPNAAKNIAAECNDETLLDLAKRLTVVQVDMKMTLNAEVSATITTSGNYSHSNTMSVSCTLYDDPDEAVPEDTDEEITACMREFADWIYDQLETEHEYLTSDEYVAQTLRDDKTRFDSDGAIV